MSTFEVISIDKATNYLKRKNGAYFLCTFLVVKYLCVDY